MKNIFFFLFFLFSIQTVFAEKIIWSDDIFQLEEKEGSIFFVHREKYSFDDFTHEESVRLETLVSKMENVFEEVFSFGDYYRFADLETGLEAKEEHEKFQMNLIPIGSYDRDVNISLLWEVKNTLALIGGKRDLFPPLKDSAIDEIAKRAPSILGSPLKAISLKAVDLYWVDGFQALKCMLQEWNERFDFNTFEKDNPFQTTMISSFEDKRGMKIPTSLGKKTCSAFCNPKVIKNQFVEESNHHYVLMNYRPYTKEDHLLIVPKKHMEKISHQSSEVIISKYQLIKDFSKAMKKRHPGKKLIWITKTGWKANQTQNHLHDHLISYEPRDAAIWMENWLVEVMNFGKVLNPPLTVEEMKVRGDHLKKFIRK